MSSGLTPGWIPVRVKKTRQIKSWSPLLIPGAIFIVRVRVAREDNLSRRRGERGGIDVLAHFRRGAEPLGCGHFRLS